MQCDEKTTINQGEWHWCFSRAWWKPLECASHLAIRSCGIRQRYSGV